ncbi:DUF1294 domain-containing protein [Prosthecobacter vanneervenii]|uniref:Uncharacterized membrane protein YsdA (DUF1294 family) n=1 Tax=Prosthecobacter vanneervenii TaxID=48466 RepID=A0A7W7Y8R6_9BACT|nr:DUF1294 domain-containing protein [Prosthecobacter vanneervenii]MBB5031702.1 uncharacterized membrane protein YsdA (DUF1294 family) [Prosthecobacter vanneervenii]
MAPPKMIAETRKPEYTARVVEWHADKGFGWLKFNDKRLFLHRRDFSRWHHTPRVGEEIRFNWGLDAECRPCAQNAVQVREVEDLRLTGLCLLGALLVLPAYAWRQTGWEMWRLVTYVCALSLITYAAYRSDKRKARMDAWRIPEMHLHLLELAGGWPGAWVAQRRLRHKCSKGFYQFHFWLIICLHQFVAFDSLQQWKYSHMLKQALFEDQRTTRTRQRG